MIILDTNVLSETMRASPDGRVVDWLNGQVREHLYLSAISLSELLLGVASLPDGKRKSNLALSLSAQLATFFGDRLLPFDAECAKAYAEIVIRARAKGIGIGHADAQIAATALAYGMKIASRDTAPFLAAGIEVIDPWRIEADQD
jgi:predicted nucleic acid-binding protein